MSTWFRKLLGQSDGPSEEGAEPQPQEKPAPVVDGNLATKPGVERRSCARVALELQVRLRFDSAEAMIASRTFDISRSGAFIAIKDPRPRGTRVRLTIEVDGTVIVLGGVVARACDGRKSSRRGMGIQFTEVTPQAAEALAKVLVPRGG